MDEKHPVEEKKVKFRSNILGAKRERKKWIFIIVITVVSFFLSGFMTWVSSNILEGVNKYIAFAVVLVIIFIGIIFDIIGMAVTAADEAPFHAMASRKMYGAKQSIMLIRNADRVSTICNDVIGDICGVISGSASAFIVVKLVQSGDRSIVELLITGLVASVTVGGKSIGKTIAIHNSNFIVYKVSVILKFIFGKISIKKLIKTKKSNS